MIALVVLGLVLVVSLATVARMLWIPVSGPLYKKGKKTYATVRAPLVGNAGEAARGTVKLDCNSGDDADRLVLKASGLQPGLVCQIWFADENGKRLGEPLEATVEADGHLRVTVFGELCHLKECPKLVVTVRGREVLAADLRSGGQPAPAASGVGASPSGAPSGAPATDSSTAPPVSVPSGRPSP